MSGLKKMRDWPSLRGRLSRTACALSPSQTVRGPLLASRICSRAPHTSLHSSDKTSDKRQPVSRSSFTTPASSACSDAVAAIAFHKRASSAGSRARPNLRCRFRRIPRHGLERSGRHSHFPARVNIALSIASVRVAAPGPARSEMVTNQRRTSGVGTVAHELGSGLIAAARR